MTNPYVLMVEWQIRMATEWLNAVDAMFGMCRHVAQMEEVFLKPQPHHRHHEVPPAGPALDDHYGHRSHDVDVERV